MQSVGFCALVKSIDFWSVGIFWGRNILKSSNLGDSVFLQKQRKRLNQK
jgi:hypothetical protein